MWFIMAGHREFIPKQSAPVPSVTIPLIAVPVARPSLVLILLPPPLVPREARHASDSRSYQGPLEHTALGPEPQFHLLPHCKWTNANRR